MSEQPTTYNLKVASEKLSGRERYVTFARLVADLQKLHSIRTDLHHSVESFEAIWNTNIDNPELMATIHQALLHNGIILYSRAVHNASEHRKQVDLRRHFTREQLATHSELCGLRNDAIAHFGPGKVYAGEWFRETIALQIFVEEPGRIVGLSRRLALDTALLQRALLQAKAALDIIIAQFHEVNTNLVMELNQNLKEDSVFRKILDECTMDLSAYLGSDLAAQDAIDSRVAGLGQGVVDHH